MGYQGAGDNLCVGKAGCNLFCKVGCVWLGYKRWIIVKHFPEFVQIFSVVPSHSLSFFLYVCLYRSLSPQVFFPLLWVVFCPAFVEFRSDQLPSCYPLSCSGRAHGGVWNAFAFHLGMLMDGYICLHRCYWSDLRSISQDRKCKMKTQNKECTLPLNGKDTTYQSCSWEITERYYLTVMPPKKSQRDTTYQSYSPRSHRKISLTSHVPKKLQNTLVIQLTWKDLASPFPLDLYSCYITGCHCYSTKCILYGLLLCVPVIS